jgi:uncharacterized membrane protein (DUF373 family)
VKRYHFLISDGNAFEYVGEGTFARPLGAEAHAIQVAKESPKNCRKTTLGERARLPEIDGDQGSAGSRVVRASIHFWFPSTTEKAELRRPPMSIKEQLRDATKEFRALSLYQRFEEIVILILTALIAVVIVASLWNLVLKILFGLVLSGTLDPSDYPVFQAVFGMIFTVIIALEFKKSLLVVADRRDSVVQIRSVVVIALLAICRKLIILDPNETDALHILAFAAAILALGVVYWLMRDRDQRRNDAV